MGRVVVLGASLMDMNLRLDRLPTPGETRLGSSFFTSTGGKGANQAVAARRAGAEVVFLSAFGGDEFGRAMRDRYFAEGIDIRHTLMVEGDASGVALILVGDDGENLIGVSMGPNARLTQEFVDGLPADVFEGPGVLLASLEVPIEVVTRAIGRAKQGGMTVVLNPAPAASLRRTIGLLTSVDILTPNQSEATLLVDGKADFAAELLIERGAGRVVLTRGEQGCHVADRAYWVVPAGEGPDSSWPETRRVRIPAHEVEVVDTVGAGDAFNGVLAAALAEGLDLVDAAMLANAAGAIAVTRPGAQGALPCRAEIDRMVRGLDRPDPTPP